MSVYLKIDMSNIVIPAEDLPKLEALLSNARRLVDSDYSHRANNEYVKYIHPENPFQYVDLKMIPHGQMAVMEMYYDECVAKKN